VRGPGPAPPERGRRIDTLPDLFRRGRPADPDSTTFLEVPGGVRLTYGDVERRTAQLAHALVAAGARRGDRVALQVGKSPEAVLAYLACVRAGAVLLPMNPAYTADEVAHLVADAEPSVVLDDAGLAALVADSLARPTTFDDADVGPDDLAAILYTSGTTGRPKGAMLSHRNLASNSAVLHELWGFRPDDVLLHVLPIFHTHGLFVAVNCTLANGTGMVFLPRFDVDAVLAELPRCTVLMGVPTHYTRLLDDPRFDAAACSGMRLFISGSAPMLASTHEAFRARTGHAVLERYGMTETSMLTSNPLEGERRPGTVGLPLPGTDVRIAEDEVVEVRGPNVFAGYWRRPELRATEFTPDGWFRTGDIGAWDEAGYLRIVGRAKDLVISGGLNVYPKEVEDVVDALPGVVESAVIGVPDPDLGEAVVAVVVGDVDPEEVRLAARERLAGFKVPKRVEVVDALPRNAMGKVQKNQLRSRFS
jgi:malonyl-CoA/methylmalonyl-CoA synthetase